MDAFEAIPILENKIAALELKEESWKRCRACPFNGKCCDGASVDMFPEEREAITVYLDNNPDVKSYALTRYSQGKKCVFYDKDASSCLIHEVRPLNCRWTPYTAFNVGGGQLSVHIRDSQCNFTTTIIQDEFSSENTITLPMRKDGPEFNNVYLRWRKITELHPLMQRADEMINIDVLMAGLAI